MKCLEIKYSVSDLGEPDPEPLPPPFRHFPFNIGPTLTGRMVMEQIRNGTQAIGLDDIARQAFEEAIQDMLLVLIQAFYNTETTIHIYVKTLRVIFEDEDGERE